MEADASLLEFMTTYVIRQDKYSEIQEMIASAPAGSKILYVMPEGEE